MKDRIGPYRITGTLGHGGTGVVYDGFHDDLQQRAAIKTLDLVQGINPDAWQRLRAKIQAHLQHPNVVAVYDLLEEGGEAFIALEYVEGTTLDLLLAERQGRGFPLKEALPIGVQLLAGLEYIHQQGVVHRDVKPSNLILNDGRIKLADFGVALLACIPRQTATSAILGTPTYMSPEQFQGLEVDRRTDLYSAAVVLYEMLAGRPPFTGSSRRELINGHLRRIPEDLKALVPSLPVGVCEVITSGLRKEPLERYQTAGELSRALREGAAGFLPARPAVPPQAAMPSQIDPTVLPPSPPSPSTLRPPRPPSRRWHATVVLGLALSGFGIWSLWRTQHLASPSSLTPPVPRPAPVAPSSAPPGSLPHPHPVGPSPAVVPTPEATSDAEEVGQPELDQVREELRQGIADVESDLRAKSFAAADDRLDRLSGLLQSHPTELQREHTEIRRLRQRLTNALVERTVAAREATLRAARYQEYVVWIEEVVVVPAQLQPGQSAKLSILLQMIGPDPLEEITVRVVRQLKYGEESMGQAESNMVTVSQDRGTVEVTGTITLPAKARQGAYVMEVRLEDPQGRFAATVGTGSLDVAAKLQP